MSKRWVRSVKETQELTAYNGSNISKLGTRL